MTPDIVLSPLELHMTSCATQEEMNGNVRATLARGHTPITPYLGAYSGTLSICGSGPSLRETCRDLKGDVLAINSAIGFLLDQGVVPKFGMIWDAHPVCESFAIPHEEITYLLGARCHPSVFGRLRNCTSIEWHAGGDHNIAQFLADEGIMEPMINGGSAGVTRAMYLACALGYTDLHLYGADSSLADDGKTHVTQSALGEKVFRIWITYQKAGVPFLTTPEMCAQVEEFMKITPHFEEFGLSVEVHGAGMLRHVYDLMQRKKVDDTMLKAA